MQIADLPQQERPRERLLKSGAGALSDAELLAILIRVGLQGVNVVDLSRRLLNEFGGLKQLSLASSAELSGACKGLGPAKAAALMAAFELGRRAASASCEDCDDQSLSGALRRWSICLAAEPREFVIALYLDSRGKVIEEDRLSYGGVDGAVLDVAYLLRRALRVGADSVALVHNHPCGDASPSEDDLVLTKMMRQKLEVLDIQLEEHYIVAGAICRSIGHLCDVHSETGLL